MGIEDRRINRSLLSILGTASLVAFAMPANANANDMGNRRQTTVHFKDLNLSDAGDRARLEVRLARAAGEVCVSSNVLTPVDQSTCRAEAIARARHEVGLDARG